MPVAMVVVVCVPILVGGGALADKIGGLLVAKEDADTVALVAKVLRATASKSLPVVTAGRLLLLLALLAMLLRAC